MGLGSLSIAYNFDWVYNKLKGLYIFFSYLNYEAIDTFHSKQSILKYYIYNYQFLILYIFHIFSLNWTYTWTEIESYIVYM